MSSLYEEIGGEETIDKLIATFYRHVLADPLLGPFFENTSIEKLTAMQKAFFRIALGGPSPDIKVNLWEVHRGRGIERQHLTKFTEYLVAALSEIGVEEDSAKRVYERIATYADDVLGESSVDG